MFILGLSVTSVIPSMITDILNSFCTVVYCKSMSVMGGFIKVFRGKREFLSQCPVVLMQHDSATQVTKESMLT